MANSMSLLNNMIILCGHYKGIDYRIREHLITREISVGDYVLTGGELAAAIITDAVVRLIPGAIGDEQSALSDSFQDNLLAPPVYTRPADYNGWKVPDVLLRPPAQDRRMAVAAGTGTDGTATTGFAERGINRNYLFDIITPYQVFYKHIDMLKNITW